MSGSELLSVLVVHWLTRPGGWRRISSRYRDTEAGEWEQVNNHEDSVGDVINWSVSPAPPWAWAPPQQRTLEKCPLQKWARAQAGARGTSYRQSYGSMMHAAASIQQALQLPSAVKADQTSDPANWPRDLAILGSFIIIIRAQTTLYFFQAAFYLLVSLFGFQ